MMPVIYSWGLLPQFELVGIVAVMLWVRFGSKPREDDFILWARELQTFV